MNGKEHSILREDIFRFSWEKDDRNVWIRIWKNENLESDIQESYSIFQNAIENICIEETEGVKIALKILTLNQVNAVEVYTESDIGCVLYNDWP